MKNSIDRFANTANYHLKLWKEKWRIYNASEREKYYADPKTYDQKMSNWFIKFGTGVLLCVALYEILVNGKF